MPGMATGGAGSGRARGRVEKSYRKQPFLRLLFCACVIVHGSVLPLDLASTGRGKQPGPGVARTRKAEPHPLPPCGICVPELSTGDVTWVSGSSRRIVQGAVGRIRDAAAVLFGRESPFIRRDEVPTLVAQMAEVETAVSSTLEKLNALAARQRKREYRALQNGPGSSTEGGGPAEGPHSPPVGVPGQSKAALRSFYGQQVLAGRFPRNNGAGPQ